MTQSIASALSGPVCSVLTKNLATFWPFDSAPLRSG
jgi:hypothetical protein